MFLRFRVAVRQCRRLAVRQLIFLVLFVSLPFFRIFAELVEAAHANSRGYAQRRMHNFICLLRKKLVDKIFWADPRRDDELPLLKVTCGPDLEFVWELALLAEHKRLCAQRRGMGRRMKPVQGVHRHVPHYRSPNVFKIKGCQHPRGTSFVDEGKLTHFFCVCWLGAGAHQLVHFDAEYLRPFVIRARNFDIAVR